MARTKTKWTYSEIYIHTYKNLESILEAENDWLESTSCRDRVSQKRKVDDLEATLRIFKSYPGICRPQRELN
jgi:hypothetical protein